MNATSFFLRQMYSGSREINYGNTVLVRRDTGQWWLGYVQDIDGDNFFVDFDSSTSGSTPASGSEWIHTSHLWPHHFLQNPVDDESVQAALRETDSGPMVFRPGTVIRDVYGMFSIVRLTGPAGSCLVNRCRMIKRLPTKDCSFFASANRFKYTKHVVHFEQAHLLKDVDFLPMFLVRTCRPKFRRNDVVCNPCPKLTAVGMDRLTFQCRCGTMQVGFNIWCRAFVRVMDGMMTAVCAEIHGGTHGRWMHWTAEAVQGACQLYLTAHQAAAANHIAVDCEMDVIDPDGGEMSMDDLAPPILSGILSSLDCTNQYRASRVCLLWRLILREYGTKRHIILDIGQIRLKNPGNGALILHDSHYLNAYKLVVTLNGNITAQTRSVVLIDEGRYYENLNGFRTKLLLIRDVLEAKGLRLPLFIAKNGYDCVQEPGDSFLSLNWLSGAGNYHCTVSSLKSFSQQVILLNYTASDRNGSSSRVNMFHTDPSLPWPERDAGIARGDVDGQLDVVIPFLRFRSTQTAAEQCRIFLAAVNDNCPAVDRRVLEKVTAVHARWVQTLVYPDEWSHIRRFLQLFGDPAQTRQWDAVDLREVDVSTLSRLVLSVLSTANAKKPPQI